MSHALTICKSNKELLRGLSHALSTYSPMQMHLDISKQIDDRRRKVVKLDDKTVQFITNKRVGTLVERLREHYTWSRQWEDGAVKEFAYQYQEAFSVYTKRVDEAWDIIEDIKKREAANDPIPPADSATDAKGQATVKIELTDARREVLTEVGTWLRDGASGDDEIKGMGVKLCKLISESTGRTWIDLPSDLPRFLDQIGISLAMQGLRKGALYPTYTEMLAGINAGAVEPDAPIPPADPEPIQEPDPVVPVGTTQAPSVEFEEDAEPTYTRRNSSDPIELRTKAIEALMSADKSDDLQRRHQAFYRFCLFVRDEDPHWFESETTHHGVKKPNKGSARQMFWISKYLRKVGKLKGTDKILSEYAQAADWAYTQSPCLTVERLGEEIAKIGIRSKGGILALWRDANRKDKPTKDHNLLGALAKLKAHKAICKLPNRKEFDPADSRQAMTLTIATAEDREMRLVIHDDAFVSDLIERWERKVERDEQEEGA